MSDVQFAKGGEMKLRQHQVEMSRVAREISDNRESATVLADVIPGGGKSWLPFLFLNELPPDTRMMWIVPRQLLREQAAEDAKKHFGCDIREITERNDRLDPCRGNRGFVLSSQMLQQDVSIIQHELERHRYLLVLDELHHAGIHFTDPSKNTQLGNAMQQLQPTWALWMTGTLDRNDNLSIFGINYRQNGRRLYPDISDFEYAIKYDRTAARKDGAIVPIFFEHHDGPVEYRDNEQNKSCRLADADATEAGPALFSALETELADALLSRCVEHYFKHGRKLLVVCSTQDQVRRCATQLPPSISKYLAIIDNDQAATDVKNFKRSTGPVALLTCMMAYEGLDDRDITHICCLTRIRSKPWIYQMLGRAWRASDGKDKCWCFCPDDPRMNDVIDEVRADEPAGVSFGGGGDGPGGKNQSNVLPIGSALDKSRQSSLDGDQQAASDEVREAESTLAEFYGVTIAELRERLSRDSGRCKQTTSSETVRQKEKRYRKQIARACRRCDYAAEVEPGTHQGKLIRLTGKSITEMTIKELERAWDYAQKFNT